MALQRYSSLRACKDSPPTAGPGKWLHATPVFQRVKSASVADREMGVGKVFQTILCFLIT